MAMTEAEEVDFVRNIAKHVFKHHDCCGLTVDDLVSEGWIAYTMKKSSYDSSRGVTLQSYAYRRVEGAMLDAIEAERPRGYRNGYKPGQDAPIRVIEYDDASTGVMPTVEDRIEYSRINRVLVRRLSGRERVILIKRAGGERLRPLSHRYNISMSRVTQIHRAAREKVRRVIVREIV